MRLAAIAKGLNGRRKEARTTTQGQKGVRALVVGRAGTSVFGTKRTSHDGLWMSVLGGETDIRQLGRDVAFWTQLRHRVSRVSTDG